MLSPQETEDLPFALDRLNFYRANPVDFFVDVLGVRRDLIWSAMRDMADSVKANRFTAVAGCHNSSKTFTAACLAWWWVICWQPAIVYVTAPKQDQLKDTFWSQLRARYEAAAVPLGGDLQTLDWKYRPDTMIVGRTARKDTGAGGSTSMQGYKSQRLLMIFDEATGIDREFWESAYGVVTFPENRWIAMANPTNPNCGFRDCFRPNSGWNPIYFDALANPNMEGASIEHGRVTGGQVVHPYIATPQQVQDSLQRFGVGSPSWESRVRGRFPTAAIDTLISLADFGAALDREPVMALDNETFVGADLAAQGDDYSVLSVIRNDELVHMEWFHEPDTTKTCDRIIEVAKDWGMTPAHAHRVSIDKSGMGVGPYDYIRRFHKWDVNGVDFGHNPIHEDYADRRTEIWVGVRDWLKTTGSLKNARPDWIQHLEADLCGCIVDPLHVKGARTVMKLEKKSDMKRRLGHSPDHGDSIAIALSPRTGRRVIDRSSLRTPGRLDDDNPRVNSRPSAEEERRRRSRSGRRAGMLDGGGEIGGMFG